MLHVSASLWEYYRGFYAEKKDASGFWLQYNLNSIDNVFYLKLASAYIGDLVLFFIFCNALNIY